MQPHPNAPLETPAPLASRVHFTLRGIFTGTALAAVVLAALAPWFRQRDDAEQRYFVVFWANAAFGAAASAAIACLMRVRLERRAGRAYYRLPRSASKSAYLWKAGAVVLWSVLAVCFSSLTSRTGGGWHEQWLFFDWFAILLGSSIASHGLSAWWHAGLEICENGLIANRNMLPWKFMLSYRWATSNPRLLLIQCRHGLLSVGIGGADKHMIAKCLDQRLAANSQPHE
jgi:hypothetical protein